MTLGSKRVEKKVPSSLGKSAFLSNTDARLSAAKARAGSLSVALLPKSSNSPHFLAGLTLKARLCAAVALTCSVAISSKWVSE